MYVARGRTSRADGRIFPRDILKVSSSPERSRPPSSSRSELYDPFGGRREGGEKGMDPIGRRDFCAEKLIEDVGGCSAALPASARRDSPGEFDAIDRVRRQEHTFMYLLRLIARALSPRAVNVYILMYVRVCIYLYILYIYIHTYIILSALFCNYR